MPSCSGPGTAWTKPGRSWRITSTKRTPVPDRTFEPSSPDFDSHVFSAGGAAAEGTAKGRYEIYIHLPGVGLTYRF
jgi:hypothetical protein